MENAKKILENYLSNETEENNFQSRSKEIKLWCFFSFKSSQPSSDKLSTLMYEYSMCNTNTDMKDSFPMTLLKKQYQIIYLKIYGKIYEIYC